MAEWSFKTKFDLEELVWANLETLLYLKPLAQQGSALRHYRLNNRPVVQ